MLFSTTVKFEQYTTAARDARVAAGKMPVGSVIENTTTGTVQWRKSVSTWLDIGAAPGAAFTPMAYITPPPTNSDADQQTWILAMQAEMISKGLMSPPPTYTVSGQVTGSVQSGITLELRENVSNLLVGTVTTNGSGNYTFTPVVAGTYRIIPSIAGHYFTPASPIISLSANTTQNFTSAVSMAVGTTSDVHVLIPTSDTGRLRMLNKSPFALNAATFTNATALAYVPTYEQGRWFVPNSTGVGTVGVWDDNGVFKGSFTAVSGQTAFRVHFSSNKMAIVTSGGIRFGTYNFTTDTFTSGNLLANEVYPLDSDSNNGLIYIASGYGGSPARNVTIVSIASETVTGRQNVFGGSVNLTRLQYGAGKLLVVPQALSSQRLVDATSFAQVGSDLPINGEPYRMAFSQGYFFQTSAAGGVMRWIKASDATTGTISGVTGTGCVADDTYVYAAESGNNRVIRVDVATRAIIGSPVTGLSSPSLIPS